MKKYSSLRTSKTDFQRVRAMKDRDIKLSSEHPELDVKHMGRVIVRRGLTPMPSKTSVSLPIDADVLEWFKAQGPGYLKRMNAVLRAYREASLQRC